MHDITHLGHEDSAAWLKCSRVAKFPPETRCCEGANTLWETRPGRVFQGVYTLWNNLSR